MKEIYWSMFDEGEGDTQGEFEPIDMDLIEDDFRTDYQKYRTRTVIIREDEATITLNVYAFPIKGFSFDDFAWKAQVLGHKQVSAPFIDQKGLVHFLLESR